ncbi:MAG: nucleotide exchange factor GrpE [Clostridia bacterium]|nr:nucleotide exchange factor GrpE [Clostridia bacterium]
MDEKKEPLTEETEVKENEAAAEAAPSAEERITALEAELKEKDDKYLRMAAEYDNFRRRSREEKAAVYADALADTVSELLPIIDNLERAALYDDGEKVKEGLMMTAKSVSAALEKLGVETMGAVGETFDPNIHNAVFHVEDESFGEGEIVEVFQKGYKKGNKIIRFAMVKTAN